MDSTAGTAQLTAPVGGRDLDLGLGLGPDPGTSASDLGLSLDALSDAAARLETIDGEAGLEGVARAVDAYGRADDEKSAELRLEQLQREAMPDGNYFGTFAEGDDSKARPEAGGSALIDVDGPSDSLVGRSLDEDDPRFIVTRRGVDEGPYSLRDLRTMIRKREIHNTDRLSVRGEIGDMMAVDHPKLREVFQAMARKEDRMGTQPNVPTPSMAAGQVRDIVSSSPKAARSGGGTLVWIIIAIVAFAAAGWVLWQRSGGG